MTTMFTGDKREALEFVADAVQKLDHIKAKRADRPQLGYIWEAILDTRKGWAADRGATQLEIDRVVTQARKVKR